MIEITSGNLFDAEVEALVNTVNTVGVMGKGIALQFRQAFPENYKLYRAACQREEVRPGRMFVTTRLTDPRFIVNFPTKRHWRGKSRMEDVEAGLTDLARVIEKRQIHSIAIPPLGCGNGGLAWTDVRPRIERALEALDVRVVLFEPRGAPDAEKMPVRTGRPRMTRGRASLLAVLERYALPGYRLNLLEVQKLAYLLKAAGEPLPRLEFARNKFGPYSETIHHVLQRIEGHFIRGYGDRSGEASIRLLPEAVDSARSFLERHPEVTPRVERVAELIEGFETPYGLELLSTVHWLAQEDPSAATDTEIAVRGVQSWSRRKRHLFKRHHIETAWSQLTRQGWIGGGTPVSRAADF